MQPVGPEVPPAAAPDLADDTPARVEAKAIMGEMVAWIAEQRAAMMRRWCQQSLSTPNLHVLMALASAGPMTMSGLAELRDISLPNATGIVTRMEERGLVERVHDVHDRRVVTVRLTDAGRDIVEELELVKHSSLTRILEVMTVTERRDLARGLRAFYATSRRLAAAGQLDEDVPELSRATREALTEPDLASEGGSTR